MDLVIFFEITCPQPHEPDVSALIRICDVYEIPVQLIGYSRVNAKNLENI